MTDFQQAYDYINALTNGRADSERMSFRCIHDQKKDIPAHKYEGTLAECWNTLVSYNELDYGIFVNINAMDGKGHHLENVASIRVHCADLDNLSAWQNADRAGKWSPPASFGVQSSERKFHVYWTVQPYTGNAYYETIQRKLRQNFDGDKAVIDPSRVLRLPGTFHCKDAESRKLVTFFRMAGFGTAYEVRELENALANVTVIDGGSGGRQQLGFPELSAPTLEWLDYCFQHVDPNTLSRGEWISFTSAVKQAGWTLTDPDTLMRKWLDWCARYSANDIGENTKQWNSIRETEVGWPSLVHRVPGLKAQLSFGGKQHTPSPELLQLNSPAPNPTVPPMPDTVSRPLSGPTKEILTDVEQREWFAGCYFIERQGEIFTPTGRFMNSTQFNGAYGGKQFLISSTSKLTNEPWQAATRSTLWTIPKVDHIRFVPQAPIGGTLTDALGRTGVNTYRPAQVPARQGDASPFLRHMELILPIENDRRILIEYMAHNAKFPGYKIPWAPLIQSVEGVGKGFIKSVMKYVMGGPYFYSPKAEELINSGSKFNAWMRARLFIVVDEIKVDERRDMIEVLKPMISEEEIEIQAKGVDQDIEDNYSNWLFLSNYKDAIPINKNARRFCIFYSAIQSKADLVVRGMDDAYFHRLFSWLKADGAAIVADYLLRYPIECGAIPMRAPDTSSTIEAQRQSRGPVEQMVLEAIEDGLSGFRGGWVSVTAVLQRIKVVGGRTVTHRVAGTILETLGYTHAGRAPRAFFQENVTERSQLYSTNPNANVLDYGKIQGYE